MPSNFGRSRCDGEYCEIVWQPYLESMNARVNRLGLSRNIPANVRREVRRRSKFGCVICRDGFCIYEHLEDFVGVDVHDPAQICLLCESCHGRITRKQWSKDRARLAYQQIQARSREEAGEPRGPLDFHAGQAELAIGDLLYAPAVASVLRYFGEDVIRLIPGRNGEPGAISAVFTDTAGKAILELEENAWVGSLDAWDIEVEGQRVTIRQQPGVVALQLRLDPPGRIVVERLDMRIGDHHVLASEHGYAVGVHFEDGLMNWMSPKIQVTRATENGIAIEIEKGDKLRERFNHFKAAGKGAWSADPGEKFIMHSPAGVMIPQLGISVASGCSFRLYEAAAGAKTLEEMRKAVFFHPAHTMRKFLSSGKDPIEPL